MSTEVKQYYVSDIVSGIQHSTDTKDRIIKISVPKMQRNLVWSNEQKSKFIDTLKRGFPFGSLLLYKREDEELFLLIDGLQRTSTIVDYCLKPSSYFTMDDIQEEYIDYLIEKIEDLHNEHRDVIKETIEEWVKQVEAFEEGKKFSSFYLLRHLKKELQLTIDEDTMEELVDKFSEYTTKLKDESDITDVQIPVVVYHGDENNLPEIFERINSKGTKLNKYQIFAATWRKQITISNQEIIKPIVEKYERLIQQGFLIENYQRENMFTEGMEFTLFEYLFGLGKYLSNRFPSLFGKYESKKADSTDSVGFNLATICLNLALTKMANLETEISKHQLDTFEAAMIDAIEFVDHALLSLLTFKAHRKNKKDKGEHIHHTELQIISLIATAFHLKYDENLAVRESWKDNQSRLRQNIPMYYLYDVLREDWRGSGDSKLKDMVLRPNLEQTSRLLQPITRSQWENVLNEWFEGQLTRSETKRVSIQDKDLLFMKYIYKTILTHDESHSSYQIDHVYAVNRLKQAASLGTGLPISCVANLAMLPEGINKQKGDKTFPEFFAQKLKKKEWTTTQRDQQAAAIQRVVFSDPSLLDIPKTAKKDALTREWYLNEMNKRFVILKDIFFTHVIQ